VEGSQIAFQKDATLVDENGRGIWLTSRDLEFIGDKSELPESKSMKKKTKSLFTQADVKKASEECNMVKEGSVLDSLPEFGNPALKDAIAS
jgi:hypothetical protein